MPLTNKWLYLQLVNNTETASNTLVLVQTRLARFEPTRGRQMDITLKKQSKAKQTNSFIHWLTTFFLDWIYKCSSFFFASRMLGRSAEITDLWHNWKKEKPCSWQWSQRKKEDKTEKPKQVVERSECLAADPWWTGGPGSTCWELPRIDKRPGSTLGPQFYIGDRGWQRNNFFLSLYNIPL